MNFEQHAENVTDPKAIFETISEFIADREYLEIRILNEDSNHL